MENTRTVTTLDSMKGVIDAVSIPQNTPKITHFFVNPIAWKSLGYPTFISVDEDRALLVRTDAKLPARQARAEFIPA